MDVQNSRKKLLKYLKITLPVVKNEGKPEQTHEIHFVMAMLVYMVGRVGNIA